MPIPRTSPLVHNAGNTNITRYFADWVLPQLDTLIDETRAADRRVDHDRSRDAARRRRRDPRQRARRRPGRAGRARPRRRGAGDGWRARLSEFELQPRHPGESPAGIVVQIVRLPRPRSKPAIGPTRSSTPRRSRSTAGRRATTAATISAKCRCGSPSLIRSTRSRSASPSRSARAPSPTWPSVSASPPISIPTQAWLWALRRSG